MTQATTNPMETFEEKTDRWSRDFLPWGEVESDMPLVLQRHKRVGELLRELHFCDPSVVPTEKQKDEEYWTGQAMMRPGLLISKLQAHLIQRKKECRLASVNFP